MGESKSVRNSHSPKSLAQKQKSFIVDRSCVSRDSQNLKQLRRYEILDR